MKSSIPFFFARLAACTVAFASVQTASAKPARPQSVPDKPVIVIGEIKNKSTVEDSKFMRSLRTRIENAIENTGKFTLSDRSAMREHEQEMTLVEMGMADGVGAPQDGNVRSIAYKVSGTVLMFQLSPGREANMEMELRIVDNNTLAVSDTRGGSQKVPVHYVPEGLGANVANSILLNNVLDKCAQQIAFRVLEFAFPPKVLAVGATDITVNIRDVQTENGDLFDVCSVGEELFDPDTGESLGPDTGETVGRVRISRPGPKFSKAVPVRGTRLDRIEKGMTLIRVKPEDIERERDRLCLKQDGDIVSLELASEVNNPVSRDVSAEMRIRRKMERIIIPEIEFRQANIVDAVGWLGDASRENDPDDVPVEERGVNFVLDIGLPAGSSDAAVAPDDPWGAAAEPAAASDGGVPPLTIKSYNMKLSDLLELITDMAGLRAQVKGNVVIITLRDNYRR